MSKLFNNISHTPYYVWIILIYLLWAGIKSLKTRMVYIPKIFMIPIILMLTKYRIFLSYNAVIFCALTALSALVSYYLHADIKVKVFKNTQSIEIPGSCSTLIILMVLFITKYSFGYLKAVDPLLAYKFQHIENITDAMFSGFFIGRSVRYTFQYYKTK